MTEAIEEVLFPALSLVFLLLGIVLLASILFSAFNPYDQIAIVNTERLRANIDKACLNPGTPIALDKFEIRQNTPIGSFLFTILPRWIIRTGGDPNYVLYYEAFPPGEATGWEIYHDMQNRLVVPITEDFLNAHEHNSNSVIEYIQNVINEYKSTPGSGPVDAVIINNIILSEGFRPDFVFKKSQPLGSADDWTGGPVSEAKTDKEKFFSYGKWKYQGEDKIPSGTDNEFKFSNYLGLAPVEKTAIKYVPCGENSLCLKTRSSVYSFPLQICNKPGKAISSIQLEYDAREEVLQSDLYKAIARAISGNAATANLGYLKDAMRDMMGFKNGDFYAASPCEISDTFDGDTDYDISLEKTACSEDICERYAAYPFYQYNGKTGKIDEIPGSSHFVCTQSLGKDSTITPLVSPSDCVKIKITTGRNGFCWTPNPYDPDESWWQHLITSAINFFTAKFYEPPIPDNTEFLQSTGTVKDVVVLKPTQTALKKGEGVFDALDRKWWWGWP